MEDCLHLPAKYIKNCIKQPNFPNIITWTWQRSGNKSQINMVYRPDKEMLEFDYSMTKTDEKIKYYVPVIKQNCNYGKERYYFGCPNQHCNLKVYKLYKAPSSKYFLCRKCQNLTYDDQKTHNKRMDAFIWMKYEGKIEELMMTGKLKDRNKAYKLIKRQDDLMGKYKDKINPFLCR